MTVQVKSVSSLLADMIRKVLLETSLTDVSEGSVIGSILEATALQDFQNQLAVLKVLESTNLQSLIGTDLDNKAQEMNIPNGIGGFGRYPARRATGVITVSSAFTKKASAIYIGKPPPFSSSVKIYIQDATGWPSSGSIYIGRGTPSEEGPIPYTSITDNSSYFTLNLNPSTPLVNNHGYSDSVILAQGGVRNIPAGSVVRAPATSGKIPVEFSTDISAQLLDGESDIDIPVSCSVFGEEGNVSGGAIKEFSSVPFAGATVQNVLSFSNGSSAEGDEELRRRIKEYVATLARGTKTAISSALLGLRDPVSGKTITSLNIVEPTTISEPAKAYIDDGSGFEPDLLGQDFELLLNNASGQEVLFRSSQFPITPPTATGTRNAPYSLEDGMYLDVQIDGVIERYRINQIDYTNLLSVGVSEIVRAFNAQETVSGSQKIGFRTANGGKNLSVFDLSGAAEKLSILSSPLQIILGLPTDEIRPLFLYLNNDILSFKGSTASVQSALYPWPSMGLSDLANVGIKVDGVSQYFSIDNTDFAEFGSTISNATLSQWASVFKKKVAGVNVYEGGGRLIFATWQEFSSSGSVEILSTVQSGAPATWIGVNKMWSSTGVLSSVGSESQFELNRLSGQIKLKSKPPIDSTLTIASSNTRAEIICKESPTGLFGVGPNTFGTAKLVVAADGDFAIRPVPVTGSATITPSIYSANSNIIRLMSSEISMFASIVLNDFLYISPNTAVPNYMTPRLNSFYRVRQKGLGTHDADTTLTNSTITFDAPVLGVTKVTIACTGAHDLVVGQKVDIQSVVLTPSTPALASAVQAIQTVTEIVSETEFSFSVSYSGSIPAGPNTCTVFIEQNTFIDIEVSDLQREAFFGLFNNSPVSYTTLSSLIEVTIPKHGLSGGSIQINSVSPALAAMFPALSGIPGAKVITSVIDENTIEVDLGSPATGVVIPGVVSLDGQYTSVFSSYDVSEGMLAAFKCENATPQIVDLGTLPTQTADQIVTSINSAIGFSAYKLSPREFAIRSNSFDKAVSNVAVLAVTGAGSVLFDPEISSGIQSHTAFKKSKFLNAGALKISDISLPTSPNAFYASKGNLFFDSTQTIIKNDFLNPDIEAHSSVSDYPVGLQEIGISGREYGHVKRVYNNNLSSPFAGFARGVNVVRPIAQSINGTNEDETSIGIRLADLPFNFTDKLVVEMDLDEVNKTTAVPMYKRALVETMQPFGQGRGMQIEFTLKDPDDEVSPGVPRPFFEINSPFKNFDFTDFNILFKPTVVHTIYPSLPFVGNPSDALVLRSSQFGPSHELRFNMILPSSPSVNTISVSHKSFEEDTKTIEVVTASLCSGPKIVGSDFTGIYTVYPSTYTSPTGAQIVQVAVSALSINLSGVFQIGNVLNIGGSLPYSGSFLIIGTPDADTIVVSAPGIRTPSLPGPGVAYDGTIAPIVSYTVAPKTVSDVKTAIDQYFVDNPVISASLTATTNPLAVIKFPTYHTHGSVVPRTDLVTMSQSFDYHAKRAPFGSIAHVHTYSLADNKIVALVQNSDPVLPLQSEIISTGFPLNYTDQECVLVPATVKSLENWMRFTAISPFFIQGQAGRVQNESFLQLNSFNLGSGGAVRITGVAANSASTLVKAAPFKVGGSLKIRTDFATAQSFPRDSIAKVVNTLPAPIYRPYRTVPSALPTDSAVTPANTTDVSPWFRNSTQVVYSRPVPGIGRFVFRKSQSGIEGGDNVAITKISPFIAKLEVTSGLGQFFARVGDMLILRGSQTASDVAYTSIFNTDNQCISSTSDMLNQYIGYPVVHVESPTVIYVIGPNITAQTVVARAPSFSGSVTMTNNGFGNVRITGVTNASSFSVGDVAEITGSSVLTYNSRYRVSAVNTIGNYIDINAVYTSSYSGSLVVVRQNTEFMFVPMLKAEKNIKTNYKSGAIKNTNWIVNPSEAVFYRIKDLGNGFGYADFVFSSHDDMQLDGMSVSTDDWIEFSSAFKSENRGRFKIVAHNGKNALVFKSETVVDEVISTDETIVDGVIGSHRWRIGPKGDESLSGNDKRLVRIWDGESVFEQDKLVISNPALGVTDWFDGSLIGSWTITKIGLDRDFDVFCEAAIPLATSTSKTVLLGNSINSVSFLEGTPYVGYKWVLGYAHNDTSQSEAELFVMPQVLDYKINPAYGTNLECEYKIGFDEETIVGVDGYKYYGGLISEAHKVIDGSSSNSIAYPGVRAAGTAVEVQAPLIKSLSLSLLLEAKDGVSLNAIKNPVKSTISTYVNSLGVGKEVVLSEISKRIQNVPGVRNVVITSSIPAAEDGVIKVGSFEVPRISRSEDILI